MIELLFNHLCNMVAMECRWASLHMFIYLHLLIVLTFCSFLLQQGATAAKIGVNYGRIADDLPSPSEVATFAKNQNFGMVKIYDVNPDILKAFANTGISLMVMLPDESMQEIAATQGQSDNWVNTNIVPYLDSTKITTILVGNEILTRADSYTQYVVPAMQNIYNSLRNLSLTDSIKISTPHAFDVLSTSFPPSSGEFKSSLTSTMQSILAFQNETGSFFTVDVYPYFAYKDNTNSIELDYALFNSNATGYTDTNTNLHYTNLFDAQMDAVYSAIKRLNYDGMEVVVSETGWPSAGDASDIGASLENAETYNNNLISHVLHNPAKGTPMKPGTRIVTYIFELFNEDLKTGSESERHFGLFYPNMTEVVKWSLSSTDMEPTPSPDGSNVVDVSGCPSSIARHSYYYLVFLLLNVLAFPFFRY